MGLPFRLRTAMLRVYCCLVVADAFPSSTVLVRQTVQHGSGGIVARGQRVHVRKLFPEPIAVLLRFARRSVRICF